MLICAILKNDATDLFYLFIYYYFLFFFHQKEVQLYTIKAITKNISHQKYYSVKMWEPKNQMFCTMLMQLSVKCWPLILKKGYT